MLANADPPIVDLRDRLSWQQRTPARLGTSALWLGSLSLLAPLKLAGLLLASGLVAPALLQLDRSRRDARSAAALVIPWSEQPLSGPDRATVAEQHGLSELQVFRARHASICTVHHDHAGCIVGLEIPMPPFPTPLSSSNAHPVG